VIRVNVDMWPLGIGARKYPLASFTIINDGTGSQTRGNYTVHAFSKNGRVIRSAEIKDWPRLSRPVGDLLAEALKALNYSHR
jgi:hypothetical protein